MIVRIKNKKINDIFKAVLPLGKLPLVFGTKYYYVRLSHFGITVFFKRQCICRVKMF